MPTETEAPQTSIITLDEIASKSGLAPAVTKTILDTFQPLAIEARKLIDEARAVPEVTDATQVTEIKASRAARLALKAHRVKIDKTRKAEKDQWLRPGQLIDGIARLIEGQIAPVETAMEEAEKFAERKEAERKAALRESRMVELREIGDEPHAFIYGGLADLSSAEFASYLEGRKLAITAERERIAKAEADRLAAEAARKAEEDRLRAENARLEEEKRIAEAAARAERERAERDRLAAEAKAKADREALEREAAAKRKVIEDAARAERDAAAAKLRAEQEARQKLQREADDRAAAEAMQKAAAAMAAKKAANAPDALKLRTWATAIESMPSPRMATAEGEAAVQQIAPQLSRLAERIRELAKTLD